MPNEYANTRQKNEIEITPEMIDTGANLLMEFDSHCDDPYSAVEEIYRRMRALESHVSHDIVTDEKITKPQVCLANPVHDF